jgi:hypothetical protein
VHERIDRARTHGVAAYAGKHGHSLGIVHGAARRPAHVLPGFRAVATSPSQSSELTRAATKGNGVAMQIWVENYGSGKPSRRAPLVIPDSVRESII